MSKNKGPEPWNMAGGQQEEKKTVKANKKEIKHDPQAESARAVFGKDAPERR